MISPAIAALADSALLIPAALLLGVFLLALREVRLAVSWAASLVLGGAATLGAKLLFHACGHQLTELDVISPSGHVSFAIIFYGGAAILFGAGRPPRPQAALGVAAIILIAAVGVSRVRTGAHSPSEVLIGGGIGAVALAFFAALHARARARPLPWGPAALGFAAALVLLGGAHFSLEHRIGGIARRLSAAFDVCPAPESRYRRRLSFGAD